MHRGLSRARKAPAFGMRLPNMELSTRRPPFRPDDRARAPCSAKQALSLNRRIEGVRQEIETNLLAYASNHMLESVGVEFFRSCT